MYVVLLHEPRRAEPWGLYVGQTRATRIYASISTRPATNPAAPRAHFEVRLLPDMVPHLNPMRQWESLDLEEALAETLRAGGVGWVEGGH